MPVYEDSGNDIIAMTVGLLIGRLIAGQRKKQEKEPVAYFYNGVRLPPLPEWDETTYPYALIYYSNSGFYALYAFSCEPAAGSKSNLALVPYNGQDGQCISTIFGEGKANSFGEPEEFKVLLSSVTSGVIWTNFDLRFRGTDDVYFEASDPVPVYE